MRRGVLVGAICFLVGGASLVLAQTTGLRPDQFIALPWTWTGVQTFNGSAGLGSSNLTQFEPNAGTTGTTVNKLAKLTATGAVVLGTGDSNSPAIVGICVTNCSTTGNSTLAINGHATCAFDGSTTTGDYVVPSITTGGDCHDTGSTTVPVGIVVVGVAQTTNTGAGNYGVDMNNVGIAAANNAKTQPGGTNTQLQYNNANAFGGVSGATSNGTNVTFANGDLLLAGSSSGTTTLEASATASGVLTFQAVTDTVAVLGTAQTFTAAQTFGEVHGGTSTVTLTSNNYNAVVGDCGTTKLLPTGTTPTVTLPNINPASGSCTIVFITTAAKSYLFNAASGGSKQNSQGFYNTRGTAAGDTVVVTLTVPSGSAATWNVSGDVTS